MGLNVGELFVNLGIKGSEKTIGAISSVKKGMNETASASLEAKAGIIAAMYAVEQLFAKSGATGTGLTNFNALIGVSTKTLQQYQYAGRQVGVSNEAMTGTFKTLQSAMAQTLMGGAAPKGLGLVAAFTGGITPADIKKFAEHPELLIQKLQEYASKDKNIAQRNEVLKSFGLGDDVNAALVWQAFKPGIMAGAPTYGRGEIEALKEADKAWSNLGTKIEMAFGHFNALHGGQLVEDFSHLTGAAVKLAEAFMGFTKVIPIFDLISKAFEGWAKILGLVSEGAKSLTGQIAHDVKGTKGLTGNGVADKTLGIFQGIGDFIINGVINGVKDVYGVSKEIIAPDVPSLPGKGSSSQQFNVNQYLQFKHDGKDAHKTGDAVKKAAQEFYRAHPAQRQGS